MSHTTSYRHELSIPSDLGSLVRAREFVETAAKSCGFTDSDVYQLSLAVDEACSNLIRHAYKNAVDGLITLRAAQIDDGIVFSILDRAQSFNPLEVAQPDMQEYFKSFRHGGLGVHLMRRIMDKIEYFPSNSGQVDNELRLTKMLHPAS